MKLLKAYETVIAQHGILASEDSYFYRLLLKLSLDSGPDWWSKYHGLCRYNNRHGLNSTACV